jgi:MOSC domain-containing protein YiiM
MTTPNQALVIAVSKSETHTMQKFNQLSITLLAGLGVENDAHQGVTVKHRSRVAQDPTQPNLRQVHLIHSELHDELKAKGFDISPGQMGENITTKTIDLLALPKHTKLHIGEAVLEVTGLRNPCTQLDGIQPGLMSAVLDRDEEGNFIRKAGIMTVVLSGGDVKPGDEIHVELPSEPFEKLERV